MVPFPRSREKQEFKVQCSQICHLMVLINSYDQEITLSYMFFYPRYKGFDGKNIFLLRKISDFIAQMIRVHVGLYISIYIYRYSCFCIYIQQDLIWPILVHKMILFILISRTQNLVRENMIMLLRACYALCITKNHWCFAGVRASVIFVIFRGRTRIYQWTFY